jgi:hypothetical protein
LLIEIAGKKGWSGLAASPAGSVDVAFLCIDEVKPWIFEEINGINLHIDNILVRKEFLPFLSLFHPGHFDAGLFFLAFGNLFHDPW